MKASTNGGVFIWVDSAEDLMVGYARHPGTYGPGVLHSPSCWPSLHSGKSPWLCCIEMDILGFFPTDLAPWVDPGGLKLYLLVILGKKALYWCEDEPEDKVMVWFSVLWTVNSDFPTKAASVEWFSFLLRLLHRCQICVLLFSCTKDVTDENSSCSHYRALKVGTLVDTLESLLIKTSPAQGTGTHCPTN